MSNFYVTIIHRREMVPEYIQKEAEQGKIEDLTRKTVLQKSLDILRTQQQIAHDNGLRTTIQMTYTSSNHTHHRFLNPNPFTTKGHRVTRRKCF
jgi:hypothetical protein